VTASKARLAEATEAEGVENQNSQPPCKVYRQSGLVDDARWRILGMALGVLGVARSHAPEARKPA